MATLFVWLQYLLPKHALTSIVFRLAAIRHVATKNFLIRRFVAAFNVDTGEIERAVPGDFETFNDFFTRELAPGSRPITEGQNVIVSPVDGTVSQAGELQSDRLLQAKGHHYSVADLLTLDIDAAAVYENGTFATIYLAPYNYHRVHMPVDGTLLAAHHIPGDLFSVNNATAARVQGLFRRNERLALHFDTALGPAALVFVGALNVGSVSTPWTGTVRPAGTGTATALELGPGSRSLNKGDLLGWFNMGSTVIVLMPPGMADWSSNLEAGKTVKMGERIGTLTST